MTTYLGGSAEPASVSTYLYDHTGARIGKLLNATSPSPSMVRRFGGMFEYTVEDAALVSTTRKYRFGGTVVAQRDAELFSAGIPQDDRLRYLAGDHLGSASIVTDEGGDLARAVRYTPYGAIREQYGPEADQPDFSYGNVEDLYNGKERDFATMGLTAEADGAYALEAYNYGARTYLPRLGTWASADSITPDFTWEANHYQYVRSNPLRYIDPTGNGALSLAYKGLKVAYKGGDLAGTFIDLAEAGAVLANPHAGFAAHLGAGLTIASEIAPVSIGDLKTGWRLLTRADGSLEATQDVAKAARRGTEPEVDDFARRFEERYPGREYSVGDTRIHSDGRELEIDFETDNAIVELKAGRGSGLSRQLKDRADPGVNPNDKVCIGVACSSKGVSPHARKSMEAAGGLGAGRSEIDDVIELIAPDPD